MAALRFVAIKEAIQLSGVDMAPCLCGTVVMLATRRLMSEFKQLTDRPTPGVVAGPASADDMFVWHFSIVSSGVCVAGTRGTANPLASHALC